MNTLNFLDANVWLALLWNRHSHSKRAGLWFEQASDEQFFFCRFTQITVLRLWTTEKVMGTDTQSVSQAWNVWDRVWARKARLTQADTEGYWGNVTQIATW
jgi:predicted nucleic acid-binding protein